LALINLVVCSSVHVSVDVDSPHSDHPHHHQKYATQSHRPIHHLQNELDEAEEEEAEVDSASHKAGHVAYKDRPNPTSPNYYSSSDLALMKKTNSNSNGGFLQVGSVAGPALAGTVPGGIKVYRYVNALVSRSRPAEIDSDGSPRSYNPQNTGIDINSDGKDGSKWVGVAVHPGTNTPYIQGKDGVGPNPGYYVSTTALYDSKFPINNCAHWVDSEKYPYLVIPPTIAALGAKQGDFAVIYNERNKKMTYAIVADSGPRSKFGEISVAAANAIGVPSSPKTGGTNSGIAYVIFNGSGHGQGTIPELTEIESKGAELWQAFGELAALQKVPAK